jgi:hypothetical protein
MIKQSLTFTISMDDIKASIDDNLCTNKTDIEYCSMLNLNTDKALTGVLDDITTQILKFANTQWNLPEETE